MKRLILILLLLNLSLSLSALQARPGEDLQKDRTFGLTVTPYTGMVYGYCNELVFGKSGSYPYLSRLQWEINPAVLAGLSLSLNSDNRIYFNLSAATALNRDTGSMTDYDWMPEEFNEVDTQWTRYSKSDISLTSSLLLDVNGALRVLRSRRQSLDLLAGFKFYSWDWSDRTLEMDYPDSTGVTIDDHYGENGIDYYIEYRIPYLGIAYTQYRGRFSGGISVSVSPFVSADAHDYHKNRGLHFYDSFEGGNYLGLSVFSSLRISSLTAFALNWDMDYIPEFKGDTRKGSGGYIGTPTENGAGTAYYASTLSASLSFSY